MPESNNVARWNVSRGLEQGSLNLDNPDLFLLGKDGKRIYVGSYPHTWLMDVGADRWRQYFIDATVADNFNRPWSTQGQYLDNCLSTLGNLHSSGFSEPPRKYLAPGTWETAMTGFLGTLSDAFKAHSVPTMANRGATDTEDGVRACEARRVPPPTRPRPHSARTRPDAPARPERTRLSALALRDPHLP